MGIRMCTHWKIIVFYYYYTFFLNEAVCKGDWQTLDESNPYGVNEFDRVREKKKNEKNVHFELGRHHPTTGDFLQGVRTCCDEMRCVSVALHAYMTRHSVWSGFYSSKNGFLWLLILSCPRELKINRMFTVGYFSSRFSVDTLYNLIASDNDILIDNNI